MAKAMRQRPDRTYADEHPGNHIPALRFAFEVTR